MLLPFFGMYGLHPDVPHLRELPVLATSRPTPVVVTRSMLARKPRGVGVPTRGESIEPVKTAVFAFIQEGPRSTKSIYALPFPYTRISYAIRLLSESRAIEPTNAWDQGMFVRAYQVKAQAAAAS
jgi:hypothetical protein